MNYKQKYKIGEQIIEALKNRKWFDWWFDDLDSRLKTEIIRTIGNVAVKAYEMENK